MYTATLASYYIILIIVADKKTAIGLVQGNIDEAGELVSLRACE